MAPRMKPQVFKTRRDVERYFSGDTIECLAEKGLSIRAIARVLNVAHTTVLKRSKRRHKGKPR